MKREIMAVIFPFIYIPVSSFCEVVMIEKFSKGDNTVIGILAIALASVLLALYTWYCNNNGNKIEGIYYLIGIFSSVLMMVLIFSNIVPIGIRGKILNPSAFTIGGCFYLVFINGLWYISASRKKSVT